MKSPSASILIAAVLLALSGAAGACLGGRLTHPGNFSHKQFHSELFAELRLDAEQQEMMDTIEASHAAEEKTLRRDLSLANHALAEALASEAEYGDNVENAIVELHRLTLARQKNAVRHLFTMRNILDDDQREIFDRHVAETMREYADQALD